MPRYWVKFEDGKIFANLAFEEMDIISKYGARCIAWGQMDTFKG